jgi:hypothetical protein
MKVKKEGENTPTPEIVSSGDEKVSWVLCTVNFWTGKALSARRV